MLTVHLLQIPVEVQTHRHRSNRNEDYMYKYSVISVDRSSDQLITYEFDEE